MFCYIDKTFFSLEKDLWYSRGGGGSKSLRDEFAPPLCIYEFLTNETNVFVNVLSWLFV